MATAAANGNDEQRFEEGAHPLQLGLVQKVEWLV